MAQADSLAGEQRACKELGMYVFICMAEKINRMEREKLVFALYVNIIVIFVVLYHITSQIL
jgi:small neutral amino acid transporter SnatA (MarC family)